MSTVDDLRAYLDGSPSPWHAAATSAARLAAAGFTELDVTTPWADVPVKGFVRRGGALVGCGGDKPDCKKGKPCGQTCIDKDDTCHK